MEVIYGPVGSWPPFNLCLNPQVVERVMQSCMTGLRYCAARFPRASSNAITEALRSGARCVRPGHSSRWILCFLPAANSVIKFSVTTGRNIVSRYILRSDVVVQPLTDSGRVQAVIDSLSSRCQCCRWQIVHRWNQLSHRNAGCVLLQVLRECSR